MTFFFVGSITIEFMGPLITKIIFFVAYMIIINILLLTENHDFFNTYASISFFTGIITIYVINPLVTKYNL